MDQAKDISEISQRSKFFFTNTMLCLLKAMEGRCVVVELRNDCVIKGRLLSVDAAMGLVMSKVFMTNVKGEKVRYDQFYIQGRKIRYVQIPDEINVIDTIQWQLNKVKVGLDKEKQMKKKLFQKKVQRRDKAQQKQQDTQ